MISFLSLELWHGTNSCLLPAMKSQTTRVYSYLRFSDPKQAAGTSVDRQVEYARRWAAERGLELDSGLSMRDEGLSAYHQQHVKQGALGVFLRAVEEDRIPSGSVLIVEGLDRLSRAEPIQAQAQLAQIINAGITVVTASDGREYNRASLKAQPMDLVYSLLVMIRAHEESDTKSKRVKASIIRLCEQWQAGTYRGQIRNGKDPAWLKWNGETWEEIPERVAALRQTLALYLQGHGSISLVQRMKTNGVSYTGGVLNAVQLYRLVRLRSLIGEKEITINEQTFRLKGYYPAMMSESEFEELQYTAEKRTRQKSKSDLPGIITGQAICYCGYCGEAIMGQNMNKRKRNAQGVLTDGARRLRCCGLTQKRNCPVESSVSVVPVERAILEFCADKFNLSSLFDGGDYSAPIKARIAAARNAEAEITRQIDRVTEAMMHADGEAPQAFIRKARELEAALTKTKSEAEAAELELSMTTRKIAPDAWIEWRELVDKAMACEVEARLKARKLVGETFDRIVVYMRGVVPDFEAPARGGFVDIQLIAKGGISRLLRIDRRTGTWFASEDETPA